MTDGQFPRSVVVSGIRATGTIHLGNFLGAVRQCVALAQNPTNECYFFVADLHTITTRPDPAALKRHRRAVVLDFLAAGLDPERATVYTQSSVPETCELAWILSCLTPVSELMRMHHFKEKRADLENHGLHANAGLLTYPVLMSADILGPRAQVVPVGDDQRQHVEMARNLAQRFNQQYGELFPIPKERVHAEKRVPSLIGSGKMAKSNEDGAVPLDIRTKDLWSKLKVAPTDPARERLTDPGTPELCNLYTLHTFVTPAADQARLHDGCRTATIGCYACKQELAQNLEAILEPIRQRRAELVARGDAYIDEILWDGGQKARARIRETVEQAKELAGIPAAQRPETRGGT